MYIICRGSIAYSAHTVYRQIVSCSPETFIKLENEGTVNGYSFMYTFAYKYLFLIDNQ